MNRNELLGALERMDALLAPENNLLAIGYESVTVRSSVADMKLIRDALQGLAPRTGAWTPITEGAPPFSEEDEYLCYTADHEFITLKGSDFYEIDPEQPDLQGTYEARCVTHYIPKPSPPQLVSAEPQKSESAGSAMPAISAETTDASGEYMHLLSKARDAAQGGEAAWRVQSTGEKLAVALVLNRWDWLQTMGYTMPEAIERTGSLWVSFLPAVARKIRDESCLFEA